MVQILGTRACNWKLFQERGEGEWRTVLEGVHSCMTCLIYRKYSCKCHNVRTHSTTIKEKSASRDGLGGTDL
jgi:hypothetical protein